MWENSRRRYNDPEIRASEIELGAFRLAVHHVFGGPKDEWFATCYGIFENKELVSKELDQAKTEALGLLKGVLEKALDSTKSAEAQVRNL